MHGSVQHLYTIHTKWNLNPSISKGHQKIWVPLPYVGRKTGDRKEGSRRKGKEQGKKKERKKKANGRARRRGESTLYRKDEGMIGMGWD